MLDRFLSSIKNRQFPLEFPGHFVDRKWQTFPRAKTKITSINPSQGSKLIEASFESTVINGALDSADRCRSVLVRHSLEDRVEKLHAFEKLLTEYHRELQQIMGIEAGKPAWECQAEIETAVRHVRYCRENATEIIQAGLAPTKMSGHGIFRSEVVPVGPTVAFVPFSTPITSVAQLVCAATLSSCPLIAAFSHHAILTGLFLGFAAEKLDLDAGAINVLFSSFENWKPFLSDRRIKAIIYTGSQEHCDTIRHESFSHPGRQLILQAGGKNSIIVGAEADIDTAIQIAAFSAFKSAGQLCSATSRVFVHRDCAKMFCDAFAQFVATMSIGPTDGDQNPMMGPLYSKKAVEKFLRFQTMAHRESTADIAWGKSEDCGRPDGCFIRPGLHLIEKPNFSSAFQSSILLCPDVCIYHYESLPEAIGSVNDTQAPFACSYLGAPENILKFENQIRTPNILINLPTIELDVSLPVPGRRQLGQYRYAGASLATVLSYPKAVFSENAMNPAQYCWPNART